MQKLFLKFAGLALLTLIFATGCTDDNNPIVNPPLGPEIRLVTEVGFLSSDATLNPGEVFKVKVSGDIGDASLKTLTVREDGSTLSSGTTERVRSITIDASDVTNNPLLILGAATSGGTWEITIEAHKELEERTYEFVLADESGNTDVVSINIDVFGELKVELVDDGSSVAGDATVLGQGTFNINVSASRAASLLKSISVKADDALVDAADLSFAGTTFDANPLVLSGADQEGFEAVISINSHTKGVKTYTVELEDENGDKSTVTFDVAVMIEYVALLINNADGPDFGGLDLDTGETVSRDDPEADVKDKGINLALPNPENWIQQIEAVNGAEMKAPDLTVSENFSYENANSRDAIVAAYGSGQAVADEKIETGDLFLVKRGDDYFLMKAIEVVVKTTDNTDYYKFDVKQVLGK